MADYALGPLPWSEEKIKTLYFRDFEATRRAIEEHPGFEVFQDLASLELSLAIFRACVADLLTAIDSFHKQAEDLRFWTRPQRERFEQSVLTITKALFAAATSSLALVDRSRAIKNRRSITEYDEKRVETFDLAEHEFIQGLRNYVIHYRIAEAGWQREYTSSGKQTKFLVQQSSLLKWAEWTESARQFIEQNPDGIDVGRLFRGYAQKAETFQGWFRDRVRYQFKEDLSTYLHYDRMLKRFGASSFWRILLTSLIQKSSDPLNYLDRHLTETEIAEILALPTRSTQQVDRIIEILDEYDACDPQLRALAHRAFGISSGQGQES